MIKLKKYLVLCTFLVLAAIFLSSTSVSAYTYIATVYPDSYDLDEGVVTHGELEDVESYDPYDDYPFFGLQGEPVFFFSFEVNIQLEFEYQPYIQKDNIVTIRFRRSAPTDVRVRIYYWGLSEPDEYFENPGSFEEFTYNLRDYYSVKEIAFKNFNHWHENDLWISYCAVKYKFVI